MFNFKTREELYEHLLNQSKVLTTPALQKAFEEIDRKDFVPADYDIEAYEDYPVPIGHGQTISQPTTVGFMLELLDIEPGNKILDVGSGSGWTTALLAHLTGNTGRVYGVERIPELVTLGQRNLKKYPFPNATIEQAQPKPGRSGELFDKILVSAESEETPDALVKQLVPGGTIVLPVSGAITKIQKKENGTYEEKRHPGFMFVPLILGK